MRVRLKGLKKTTQKLADGSTVTYFYAWRGGPRLPGKPGDPEFLAAYNAAIAESKPKSGKVLATILDAYQDSEALLSKKERTQKDYKDYLKKIGKEFGDFPLEALSDPGARGQFLKWRDKLAKASPRAADYAMSVFARVLSWAKDRGLATHNPLERHGRVWKGNRNDRTWSDADEAAMLAELPAAPALAMRIALWTAMRQGDILRLKWSQYDGELIRYKQGKTNKEMQIPVARPLKVALDAALAALPAPPAGAKVVPLRPGAIISYDGKPYTGDGFRAIWGRAAARAKIENLTFHDLRGTFATRAYEAGCTDAEVAAITGHGTEGQSNATLRRHYLHLNLTLARECIAKLEKRAAPKSARANGVTGNVD